MQGNQSKKFLTANDLFIMGIACQRTLSAWREKNIGPKFIRTETGRIRYPENELHKWIEQHEGDQTISQESDN